MSREEYLPATDRSIDCYGFVRLLCACGVCKLQVSAVIRGARYGGFDQKPCRVHDFLLSRLSNDDDLEKGLSTFASEMASSAMILGIHKIIFLCANSICSNFYLLEY